jgi:hypothetical protein
MMLQNFVSQVSSDTLTCCNICILMFHCDLANVALRETPAIPWPHRHCDASHHRCTVGGQPWHVVADRATRTVAATPTTSRRSRSSAAPTPRPEVDQPRPPTRPPTHDRPAGPRHQQDIFDDPRPPAPPPRTSSRRPPARRPPSYRRRAAIHHHGYQRRHPTTGSRPNGEVLSHRIDARSEVAPPAAARGRPDRRAPPPG